MQLIIEGLDNITKLVIDTDEMGPKFYEVMDEMSAGLELMVDGCNTDHNIIWAELIKREIRRKGLIAPDITSEQIAEMLENGVHIGCTVFVRFISKEFSDDFCPYGDKMAIHGKVARILY